VPFSEQVEPASGGTPSRPYPERKESRVCGTTVAMGRLGGTSEAYRPAGPFFFHFSMLRNREIVSTTPLALTEDYQFTSKYIDFYGTLQNAGGLNWVFCRPSFIAQGYGIDQRIGDVVRVKRIVFRGLGYSNNVATAPQNIRVMIFVDHQSAGGALTAATYFAYFSNALFTYPIPDWNSRFTVLVDFIQADTLEWFSHYVDVDVPVHYDGTNESAITNQIYVGIVYDDNSSADTAGVWCRLFFEDC